MTDFIFRFHGTKAMFIAQTKRARWWACENVIGERDRDRIYGDRRPMREILNAAIAAGFTVEEES